MNTKLAFVNGYIKPPPSIARKQAKYGTGNDIRNKKFNVNLPGISVADNGGAVRYSRTSGTIHDRPDHRPRGDQTGRSRVNIQSNQREARTEQRQSAHTAPKKSAPLMAKALRGINRFRR